MTYVGGEGLFQTCESCHAPIIVPAEVFESPTGYSSSYSDPTDSLGYSFEADEATDVVNFSDTGIASAQETTQHATEPPREEIIDLLREGRKIEAVKITREAMGVDLATSKSIVEKIAEAEGI